MFGSQYFGQSPFASEPVTTPVRQGTGGGWSSRGFTTPIPKKRPTGLPSLPSLPKPPYLYYTVNESDG